jgi:hypothetical protein
MNDNIRHSCKYLININVDGKYNGQFIQGFLEILNRFVEAVNFGMFYPGELTAPLNIERHGAVISGEFAAMDLPIEAFRVLNGMLIYCANAHSVSMRSSVTNPDRDTNFLSLDIPGYPASPNALPFAVQIDPPRQNQPFLAMIEFVSPVSENQQGSFLRALEVWDALVLGGFSPENTPSGGSVIWGPKSTRFLHPCLVQHSADGLFAHIDCFGTLINAVYKWHYTTPVLNIEIS